MVFFIERVTHLSRMGGRVGVIIPSYWVSRSQTARFRSHVLSEIPPESFIVLPENVFAGVQMDSCVLTARRGAQADTISVAEIQSEELEACEAVSYLAGRLFPVPVSAWNGLARVSFNPRICAQDIPVLTRVENERITLGEIVELTQGLTLYRRSTLTEKFGTKKAEEIVTKRLFHSDHRKDKTFKKELLGKDVSRYAVVWNGRSWVSYGPWLAHAVDERFFHGPRLVIQKIRNPSLEQRLVAGYLDDDETYSAGVLLNAISRGTQYSLLLVLALLNSRLLN